MRVLLTGFEPFGSSKVNPSEQVVQALSAEPLPGVDLYTAVLPVERQRGPAVLMQAVEVYRPEAVLCLGEAGRRAAVSVERVAINLLDFGIADNAGSQAVDEPIAPDGPAAYFVTLPVRAMVAAVLAAGVPAELSLSAGTFLCNQVAYELLHYLAGRQLAIPAGFVHLPLLPEQAVAAGITAPTMSLETMCRGVKAAIGAIVTP
jgi:pyroglutamyl-peptidase